MRVGRPWIVTIDGPSSSGKGTVGRLLARKLGFTYLDTGAMYRAFALLVARARHTEAYPDLNRLLDSFSVHFSMDRSGNVRTSIQGEDVSAAIRTPAISMLASELSKRGEVRQWMKRAQQAFGLEEDLVAEGRDMGTVVFPDAQIKFFLDAALDVRARRRYLELTAAGEHVTEESVLRDMEKRDTEDRTRNVAPLVPAPDAVVVDSSGRSPEEVLAEMGAIIAARFPELGF